VRPEHVVLGETGAAAMVKDVQPVGPSTLVTLVWDGGTIHARLNGIVRLQAGSPARFAVNPQHLMFFERRSGTASTFERVSDEILPRLPDHPGA
jgi:ABC-type sugar transport system ATPase subunit